MSTKNGFLGTNVMIAVISYTGYDLEDATCVNKMSRERGIMYGTIYKTKMVDLQEIAQAHVTTTILQLKFYTINLFRDIEEAWNLDAEIDSTQTS